MSQTITVTLTRKRKRFSSPTVNFFDELPQDIWSVIADYLDPLSIQTVFTVSKALLPFWKKLFYGKLIYSAKLFDSLIHSNFSSIEKNARFLKRVLKPNNAIKIHWDDSQKWRLAFLYLVESNQVELLTMFVDILTTQTSLLDKYKVDSDLLRLIDTTKQTAKTMVQIFRFCSKNPDSTSNSTILHRRLHFKCTNKQESQRSIEYIIALMSETIYVPSRIRDFIAHSLDDNVLFLPLLQIILRRKLVDQARIDRTYLLVCGHPHIDDVIQVIASLFPLVSSLATKQEGFTTLCTQSPQNFSLIKWIIQIGKLDPFLDNQKNIILFFGNLDEPNSEKLSKDALELFLSDSRFDPSLYDNQLFYTVCENNHTEAVKMLLKIPQVYTTVKIERAIAYVSQQINNSDRAYRICIMLKSHLIVKTFLNHFVKADGLKVMHQWCKYWRLENGETNPSEITAQLLRVLCFEPFSFMIGDDYLQFFDQLETLRVFNSCLSEKTLMFVKNFKKHNEEIGFFKTKSQVVFQAVSYNNFQYNELFDLFLNRKFMLLHFFISIFQFDTFTSATKEIIELRKAIGGHLWLSIHLFLSRLPQELPYSSISSVNLLKTLETTLGPTGNIDQLYHFLLHSYASK